MWCSLLLLPRKLLGCEVVGRFVAGAAALHARGRGSTSSNEDSLFFLFLPPRPPAGFYTGLEKKASCVRPPFSLLPSHSALPL